MQSVGFPPLRIKGKSLIPIVQGGMGVGISAHRLAGSVARLGGMGTIASPDLRRHHPDLMERSGHGRDKAVINEVNLIALDREIQAAREIARGRGMVAVNVMRAVSEYAAFVRQACESGAEAIVMGAGLPLDLPDLTANYPAVALIPILSDVRGIGVVLKKWARKARLPDAIVIEHPFHAGGHLGATRLEDLDEPRFDFEAVIPGALELFRTMGIEPGSIPLIAAGGINSHEKLKEVLALGASAAQVGTPFAVTEEGDAHVNFKKVLANATPDDIVTFMSDAGLPARAVRTPWLARYLDRAEELQQKASGSRDCLIGSDCLIQCGLRDGNPRAGQFCIAYHLAAALRGDVEHGLFFRGAEPLPFGAAIRPVRELVDYFLTGVKPPSIAWPEHPAAVSHLVPAVTDGANCSAPTANRRPGPSRRQSRSLHRAVPGPCKTTWLGPAPRTRTDPCTTGDPFSGRSGRQPLDLPARSAPGVPQPVVQPAGPTLPELDGLGIHPVAAPVLGARDLAVGILAIEFASAGFELHAIGYDFALLRGPGAQPGAGRAALEVGVGFLGRDALDRPFDPHLALQVVPVENEGRARVGRQLAPLAALVVREEGESPLVITPEQDDPRRGPSVRRRRRQGHRVGFGNLGQRGDFEPSVELPDRIGVQVGLGEAEAAVVPARFMDTQWCSPGSRQSCGSAGARPPKA